MLSIDHDSEEAKIEESCRNQQALLCSYAVDGHEGEARHPDALQCQTLCMVPCTFPCRNGVCEPHDRRTPHRRRAWLRCQRKDLVRAGLLSDAIIVSLLLLLSLGSSDIHV